MNRVFVWIIGAVISVIVVGIIGIMLAIFSPQIAKEMSEQKDLFI